MLDSQVRPASYLRLMALVALLGIVSALVTFALIVLINRTIPVIWEQARLAAGLDARLFTFLVCTGGCLLVGLLLQPAGEVVTSFR